MRASVNAVKVYITIAVMATIYHLKQVSCSELNAEGWSSIRFYFIIEKCFGIVFGVRQIGNICSVQLTITHY